MYPYLITNDTVTILKDYQPIIIDGSHPNFEEVKTHLRNGNWDAAVELMSPVTAVSSWASGLVISGNTITYKGEVLDNAIVPHILELRSQGFDVTPFMNFLGRLLANPSMRSRNQMWRFISTNKITITPDGNLLFYKKVKDNYWDCHTGCSNHYTIGSVHTMDRSLVDDDPESTCSHGLHVCSYEYLKEFGGQRTLICEVDPADVVSVPIDYKNTKVRVCKLKVLSETSNPTPSQTTYA